METFEYNIEIKDEIEFVQKLHEIPKSTKNFIIFTGKQEVNQ